MAHYLLPPINRDRPARVPAPPPGATEAEITGVLRTAYHAPTACHAADPTAFAVSVWNRRWSLFGGAGWAAQAARDAADLSRARVFDPEFSEALSATVLASDDHRIFRWTSGLLGHDLACEAGADCATCAAAEREDCRAVLRITGLPVVTWRDFLKSLVAAGLVERVEAPAHRAVIRGAPIPDDLDF